MDRVGKSKNIARSMLNYIKGIVDEQTKNCFRVEKAKVQSAPNSVTGKCGVILSGDTTVLTIPYSSECSDVRVGDIVLVGIVYNDLRNAVVWHKYSFR